MVGACAAAAGIGPTRQPEGTFNQFACSKRNAHFCRLRSHTHFDRPATLHPVRLAPAWVPPPPAWPPS